MTKGLARKIVKKATLIEMVIVGTLIAWILFFVINRITNNDSLKTEKNIAWHLKNYMTTLKMTKINNIDSMHAITFKDLYLNWDMWTNTQGFAWVISNCKYEAWAFNVAETEFANKFRIAAVGKDMAPEVDTSMVDWVRSILTKLWSWKITFVAWKKWDFVNNTSTEYNSLWNYVYIAVVEHSSAGDAEFFSEETWQRKYYNAALLDSNGIVYDWLTSKQLVRSILTEWASSTMDYNQLTELNKKVMEKVKTAEDNGNCLTAKF